MSEGSCVLSSTTTPNLSLCVELVLWMDVRFCVRVLDSVQDSKLVYGFQLASQVAQW